jgi:nitrogen-specific signal transduction histidine kinase/CheY-like chemotaxis protein
VSYLVIWRDIGQQIKLERELRQAQKMEPLGLIAGGIAHDFNNVLAAIIGFSELALEDVPDDSRAKRFLRNIAKAGMRGKELVRHIMTLSGRHAEEYRPVEMASVVRETLGMLRASIPAPIEIKDDIRDEKSVVIADPTQLQQVLMNLSTNASHAMRERGGTIKITLTRSTFSSPHELPGPGLKPGDYMRLKVSDTGPGIPEPILQHIFDPFFTTKKQGEGTGLGLSVSLAIVKNHGGAITVASVQGKGSTFDVYWPVWRTPALEEPTWEGEIPRGHERLLFVDDDESIADMEKVALERLGYRVAVKTDSIEALETFRHDPGAFDLVIADQVMPRLSGRDLAKRLMAVRPDVPIILMTGFSEIVTADEMKTVGIRDLLLKTGNQARAGRIDT